MKKIFILAFMGMTSLSFSKGFDFKLGFDSYRRLILKDKNVEQGIGLILGLDGIVYDSKYVDLGLGLEYNGGLYFNEYKINKTYGYTVPIYGLAHLNVYKDKNASVYSLLRVGYEITKAQDLSYNGIYYGIGLGVNIKSFVFEGIYDGMYIKNENAFVHKIGIRIGYSLDFEKLKTDAQRTSLVYPQKIRVKDISNLTDEEKLSIINGIKEANKEAPIKDIKVDNEGNVLITYKDNSTYRIDKSKVIMATDAQKTVLNYPEKLGVNNLSNLTNEEKLALINNIKEANKEAPIKDIIVDNNGNVTVIYNDGTRAIMDKTRLVRRKTDAERTVLLEPETVQVYNLSKLTEKEKSMVVKAILGPNKNAPIKQIIVDDEGNVLIIYNDGTSVKLDKTKTVREKEIEVVKGVLPTNCTVDAKKCIIRGFEIDGKEPSLEEQKSLIEIAKVMNQYSDENEVSIVDIIGHTDSTGTEKYNQKLSIIRANNVAELLRKYGLSNSIKFGTIKGEGETNPIDTNRTIKGRYNNRRVVIIFDKLQTK